ncbi:uncharacterized protein LOC110008479 [Amborella trichopoda]|uniref:uncharacterized protein LOC110008479 n=1 Tax=Amborella trichopoda TaxID=13333 RepID=UPI0009C1004D|nr:uncharacterized protein LOC110008479 [Amborella trichopoda]|eukprot:XP_020531704.1 uncharacterized protein LOC110008479 [Amborella trichopoda]
MGVLTIRFLCVLFLLSLLLVSIKEERYMYIRTFMKLQEVACTIRPKENIYKRPKEERENECVYAEMGRVVEGRICESPSIEFQGPCIIRSNCANVGKTEGFEDGHCEGIWLICMCTEQC